MRKVMINAVLLTAASGVMTVLGHITRAQTVPSSAPAPDTTSLAASHKLDDALLEWPLPPGEQMYSRIDGKHLSPVRRGTGGDLPAVSRSRPPGVLGTHHRELR